MCGLAGYLGGNSFESTEASKELLSLMSKNIIHRGPDSSGIWLDEESRLGLAHQRLSVLDLTKAGHQPMISRNNRYVIAYNGEIYNHLLLRKELKNSRQISSWKGSSDTETLLSCIQEWGLKETLSRIEGMFSFALWDRKNRELTLTRDRIGEKPLYYGWQNSTFLFASELKALKVHPSFEGKLDKSSIDEYLRFNYVPGPNSIYKGIKKLPPGTFLTVSLDKKEPSLPIPYWNLLDVVKKGEENTFKGNDLQAVDKLEELLTSVVSQQLISDVPLGAFLSGGIDSSLIVAIMQKVSANPISTFTVAFKEKGFNEAIYAKGVANYLGTDHKEIQVTSHDALKTIPEMPKLFDEPFSDSSQIPTYLISKLAKENVTVSLSGDAGDELFGGYNRYVSAMSLASTFYKLPLSMQKILHSSLSLIPLNSLQKIGNLSNIDQLDSKFKKALIIMNSHNFQDMYLNLISSVPSSSNFVLNSANRKPFVLQKEKWPSFRDFESCMMYLDTLTYLPDDILTKVDRSAMGISLETRIPFLDPKIIEFAWALPLNMKIRNGKGKWILRKLLNKLVPAKLTDRPKKGFAIPLGDWLKGPLREWSEDLLDPHKIKEQGIFDSSEIINKWNDHLKGSNDWHGFLWSVLMFQSWYENSKK